MSIQSTRNTQRNLFFSDFPDELESPPSPPRNIQPHLTRPADSPVYNPPALTRRVSLHSPSATQQTATQQKANRVFSTSPIPSSFMPAPVEASGLSQEEISESSVGPSKENSQELILASQEEEIPTELVRMLFAESPGTPKTTHKASPYNSPMTPEDAYRRPQLKRFGAESPVTPNTKRRTITFDSPLSPEQKNERREPCKSSNAPPRPKKAPPPAPTKAHHRRADAPLSGEAAAEATQLEKAQQVWAKIRTEFYDQKRVFIGEGHFHTVFSNGEDGVIKVPNRKEEDASARNRICFLRTRNANRDFQQMLALQATNAFPKQFRVAATHFDEETAVIRQERCERTFELSDLKQPGVIKTLQILFRDGFLGKHNMDLKPDNLGWKKGQLLLIDFREENEKDAGTFDLNMNKFLKAFSEQDPVIARLLDPRLNGLLEAKK